MQALALPLLTYYLLVMGVVCLYGLHRYWMVWTFLRHRRTRIDAPRLDESMLPRVTIQLPMFNELLVAQRIIEAACAVDYPGHLLQVQVLDDSTDESAQLAKDVCREMVAQGHDVHYIHRTARTGYKAGALANGHASATGELVAVFDADFVPPPDILRQIVGHFSDPSVGMVQVRWAHLNRDDSLLTRIQAMYLDGHFVVEQAARAGSGRWFNFNGTAGIWRRTAIESAGGWQHDTLTEDTDLSYRAQLAGWRFVYRPDITCPAEVPPTLSAFLTQQHRWNKGLIETAIKLMPRIWNSSAPLKTKIEAWFHLTSPMVHLFILLLVLLAVPTMFVSLSITDVGMTVGLAVGGAFLALGVLAACTFYVVSQWAQGISVMKTLMRLPALMAVGVGISVVNSRAVVGAVFGCRTPFLRTPKYNGRLTSSVDPAFAIQRLWFPPGVIETVLGVVMTVCVAWSFVTARGIVATPFLILFASGFLAVGLPLLSRRRNDEMCTVTSPGS